MGCFQSKTVKSANLPSPDDPSVPHNPESDLTLVSVLTEDQVDRENEVPCFKEFALSELFRVTNGFSPSCIVSQGGETSANVVYKAKLDDNRLVAIKRFSKVSWPDAKQFVDQATVVGKLRSNRLANLIGCCAEAAERLLVAEYMPNDTLSKHLFFNWDKQPLPWEMRVRVADYIAQALDHFNKENIKIYHDLNADRILFDEECDPRLSSFGLMKNSRDGRKYSTNLAYTPPEYSQTGRIIPESVIYSYGSLLIDLLSGKHIPPNQALDIIREGNASRLMDSSLEGVFENENAAELVDLAFKCLQKEAKDRPDTKFLVSAAAALQTQREVASHVLLKLPTLVSPLGKACSRMDLAAVHEILLETCYRDEDYKFSFQEWTQQMQEMVYTKKDGDIAFRKKDFSKAVEFYSKLVVMMPAQSATVFARRSFSYLMTAQHDNALRDALQAQVCKREWPTAFYLQSLALSKLGMDKDANDMLIEAAAFEAKSQQHISWR